MVRRRMSPGSLLLSSLAAILVVETMLIGGVDSFATGVFRPSLGHNINIKLSDAVGTMSQQQGRRALVQANEEARRASATSTAATMTTRRAGNPLLCSSALFATDGSRRCWFGAQRGLLPLSEASSRDRLDRDHGVGGGGGWGGGSSGGGRGGGGGEGGGGNGNGGRHQQPELLISAAGLAGALDGLKEALQNLRPPWAPKQAQVGRHMYPWTHRTQLQCYNTPTTR